MVNVTVTGFDGLQTQDKQQGQQRKDACSSGLLHGADHGLECDGLTLQGEIV
jgi:hypothetical protein